MIGTNNINKVTHNWKVELTLNAQTMAQIATLHTLVPSNLEWSGRLLYKVTEGSIEDKNMKLEAVGIFPCDIGTSGGTSFDIMNHFDALDELYDLESNDYKQAIIHTHHSMSTFFSGTDWSDLTGSAESEFKRGWCLSVIVNYAMDIQAKICWVEESKIDIPEYVIPARQIEIMQFGKKTPVIVQPERIIPASSTSEVKHHIVDCNIFIQSNLNEQIAKLEKIRSERPKPVYKTIGKDKVVIGQGNKNWFDDMDWNNYSDFTPELPNSNNKPKVYELDNDVDIIEWAFYTFRHAKMKSDCTKYNDLGEVFKDILFFNAKNKLKVTEEELYEYIEDSQEQYDLDDEDLYSFLLDCKNTFLDSLKGSEIEQHTKEISIYFNAIENTMNMLEEMFAENQEVANEQNIDIAENETFG